MKPFLRPVLVILLAGICVGTLGVNLLLIPQARQKPEITTLFKPTTDLIEFAEMTKTKAEILSELEQLKKVLQKQPESRDVLFNIALLHLSIGEKEAAEEYLARVRQIDPTNPLLDSLE